MSGETSVSARRFYDGVLRRLLLDYVRGNPRLEAALRFALSRVSTNARRILDLGCGIGWSTFELHRHRGAARVRGVDLSPVLVQAARRLFGDGERLSFDIADLTADELDDSEPFDVVTLLDVYEHIPRSARARLHQILDQVLSRDGVLILTCPSPEYQRYLRSHEPGGLQPVDEDVTEEDMRQLARTLHGQVAAFQPATVNPLHPNDYNYISITRGRSGAAPTAPGARLELQDHAERRRRVRERLGLAVSHGDYVLRQEPGPTVCVAYHSRAERAESFVLQQIESLPTTVCLLLGAQPFDEVDDRGRPLVSPHPLARAASLAGSLVRRRGYLERHRDALARWLKDREVAAVLAQFSPQARRVMYACERAGVALVAHFHGADAYAEEYVGGAWNEKQLRVLFRIADRIVVVSRHMHRQLESLGAPSHKLRLNPYGIDLATFAGARPAEASPRFVAVGRFVAKKAPFLTVLAFRRVLDALPDATLTMIGEGPLREGCVRLAGALGLDRRVSFPGAYPHRAVVGAMLGARAFVQHSLRAFDGDSEGTPVGILEAAASGLPVVSTRHAGIVEAVVDGHTGLLVDEGDWEGMAAAMIRLAEDPALAGRMGGAGRDHVAAHYSLPARVESLWAIIREAIAERRRS